MEDTASFFPSVVVAGPLDPFPVDTIKKLPNQNGYPALKKLAKRKYRKNSILQHIMSHDAPLFTQISFLYFVGSIVSDCEPSSSRT
jgi:hypothetical protein